MVPKERATMLVAALLTTVCPIVGAPVLPGGGSNFLDRSIRGLQQVTEHHQPWDSAAVYHPTYDQYGFEPLAHADHSTQSEAWPDASAVPHDFAGMYTWSNVPPRRHPRDELMDTDDVLGLFQDSDQNEHASPLRSTTTESAQQSHLASPAGVGPGFRGSFDNHVAGTHTPMGASGSSWPSSPMALNEQTGSSSLPGESSVGQAWGRGGRSAPVTVESIQEQKKLRAAERQRAWRQRIKLEEAKEVVLMRQHSSISDEERGLLRRGDALFTVQRAALQPGLDFDNKPSKGFVKATTEQTLLVQEVLTQRLGKFKLKRDETTGFQLTLGPDPIKYKPQTGDLFTMYDEARLAGLNPFGPPNSNGPRHARRYYLDDFVLGDYLIRVQRPNDTDRRAVWAFPVASVKDHKSEWEKGDPKTVFVGWLSIQEI